PPEKMRPFRDFIGPNLDPSQYRAVKIVSDCNWVQGLEGNLDTAHISFLHRNLSEFRLEPDESDRPGYPTDRMSTVIRARDQSPRIEVEETWYGFRYAGVRTTPAGHTHVRVTDFILPFMCYISTVPVGGDSCLMMVPIDDDHFFRMSFATKPAVKAPGAAAFAASAQGVGVNRPPPPPSPFPERQSLKNDYFIDREAQKTVSYTGIRGIAQQDMAVTESMGPIFDRTREHLGSTDAAIIKMRRMLIKAAKDLANGIEPPALEGPFHEIRSAEKILAPGEDWRLLGTPADPLLAELKAAPTS
ncbi:MAG TPA: phthalate 4,5-dioxygenase, partial [Dehalococcoidia bacterium]|nr:phthalate 4,5-dioxygenase [Dehalococcoidia bacterium]